MREYAHPALMLATAALLVVGIVVLWGAGSFVAYITGLLMLALAAACFLGARELKPPDRPPSPPGDA